MSFDEIFSTVFTYTTWFGFYVCLFSWKKIGNFNNYSLFSSFPYSLPVFKKNHRFRNIVYPSLRLWCYGGPHVIKVEIKRTKMIFFAFISIRFSVGTVWLHMYCNSMSWRNWSCTSYWGDVTFAYVELRITRSIFAIPLDFEIARLTCI